jgi:hypothetical protein
MDEYFEIGLYSFDVATNGTIVVTFSDFAAYQYPNQLTMDQDCATYDAEVMDNLRKYIVCYCNHFGSAMVGKKMIFDLAEPNGNIVRIV